MANLIIDFLDVGQGDGIFVQFPDTTRYSNTGYPLDGTCMIVDMGSLKNRGLVLKDIMTYFQNNTRFGTGEGVVLDYLVLTHGDADHYNRLRQWYEKFKPQIKNIIFSGNRSDYGGLRSDLITGLSYKQRFNGYDPPRILTCPDVYPAHLFVEQNRPGGVEVFLSAANVVQPYDNAGAHTKNSNSIVTHLKYAGNHIILSGDATRETEKFILDTFEKVGGLDLDMLDCTLLKVGHHGSTRTSILPKWAEHTDPAFLIVSSDRHGEVSSEKNITSGHRLPTELCFDIFRENATLPSNSVSHTYVSAYDRSDYVAFNKNNRGAEIDDPYPDEDPMDWIESETREGIFTTLARIDGMQINGKWADVGQQIQVVFKSNGDYDLYTTLDNAFVPKKSST